MAETFTLEEDKLPILAQGVIDYLVTLPPNKAKIVLLEGDLGAGKTTFTKVLAENLGVTDTVKSPTFILKREYTSPHTILKKIVHIDAYRFNNHKEAKVLRLEDDLQDGNTVLIVEWPSKMNYLKGDIRIAFDVVDDATRKVSIQYENQL